MKADAGVENAEKGAAQDERLARQYQHFTNVCTDLNKKVDEDSARQDGRLDELATEAQLRVDRFTEACSNLDTKFSAKNAAQDERLDVMHRHFTDVCTGLDKQFGERAEEEHQSA